MPTATKSIERTADSRLMLSEDWLSVGIGLAVFLLAIAGIAGVDLLGWVGHHLGLDQSRHRTQSGVEGLFQPRRRWRTGGDLCRAPDRALGGRGGAQGRRQTLRRRLHGGVRPRLRELDHRQLRLSGGVTPADLQRFGIGWSLKLTNEGGFIVALLAGIVIANFFPRFADWLKEASAPSSISRSRS